MTSGLPAASRSKSDGKAPLEEDEGRVSEMEKRP